MSLFERLRWPLPYLHPMALAPIDVWLRLLRHPRARIPFHYWPRLTCALLCSVAATLATLPERLLYGCWTRWHPPEPRRLPPPLFILGYYRSGTTHLQYLLSCDPRFYTPRWCQVLAPQGFALTWALLRFVLVPFLPATRPQDAMRFGATAPAEDDFALNNWALVSSLPGRAVVPQAHAFYDRFHDLERLSADELGRWRQTLLRFVHKLALVGGGRRALLKTPSHTARVAELLRLFPDAQFVHISRDPQAVLASNVALLQVAQRRYGLQDPVAEGPIRTRTVAEYTATEERYLRERALIPPGQLAEIRLEDLLADPLGQLQHCYGELALPFSEVFRRRLLRYLETVRDYRPNVHPAAASGIGGGDALTALARRLGHDRAPVPAVAVPRLPRRSRAVIVAVTLATALGCALLWSACVRLGGQRCDWLIWPTGIAIGLTARADGALGRWAVVLALLTLAGAATATTWMLHPAPLPIDILLASTLSAFRVEARLFWLFMGLTSAYKLAASDQT